MLEGVQRIVMDKNAYRALDGKQVRRAIDGLKESLARRRLGVAQKDTRKICVMGFTTKSTPA